MVYCCVVFSALWRCESLLSLTLTWLELLSLYQGTVWLLKWHNEPNISPGTIQSFQGLSTTGQWLQKSHLSLAEALFRIASTEKQCWVTRVQWTEGGCLTGSTHNLSPLITDTAMLQGVPPRNKSSGTIPVSLSNVDCPWHCYITNVSS